MLEYLLQNFVLFYLLEVGAAISGIWYLNKRPHSSIETKIFVAYLWVIVFVELIGLYPSIAYFTDYKMFSFTKDSPIERNFWWYNSLNLISIYSYSVYFTAQLKNKKIRKIFWTLTLILLLTATINLIFFEGFFSSYSAINSIMGTVILVVLILFYYWELLKSDKLLNFYQSLSFYISVAVLIWFLVITPLFIYSKYFSLQNSEFVSFHSWILKVCNIFLYGTFIFGFLICSKRESNKAL